MRFAAAALALSALALLGCGGAAVQAPEATPNADGRFSCRGNEPFWDLEIEGGLATYRALAEELRERRFAGALSQASEGSPARLEWRGTEGEGGGELIAAIVEERCLDTMSDETPPFDFSVRLTLPGGEVVNGCCREGAASGE